MSYTTEIIEGKEVKIFWELSGDVLSTNGYCRSELINGIDDDKNEYEAIGTIDCGEIVEVYDLEKVILTTISEYEKNR